MLSNYYKPEKAASPYLGENRREAFAEAGFEMVFYTPVPTRGISPEVREEYKHRLYEEELDGKLKVHRFPLMKEGKNPLQRAFRYTLSILKLYRAARKEHDIDVLLIGSTPPINGLMFKGIKKKLGCKIVYNLQDMFPDSLVTAGIAKKGGLLWKIGSAVEARTYRDCDHIVALSEDFKTTVLSRGVAPEKVSVIRNWVDEQAVFDVPRCDNALFDTYGLDRDKFYVCYSGNVGLSQNMDLLLDVAARFAVRDDIGFIVVGEGAYKKQVQERIRQENIQNVTLLPFQPYDKIAEVFSLGDCGLIISKAGTGGSSVPSKTWSVMAASRPVLASFDKGGELDTIIHESGCGVCVPANDADALYTAIEQLADDAALCKQFGENGRRYIEENLTRAVGTAKWVDVMRRVTEQVEQREEVTP